jgi:hypothetical protein
MEANGLRVIDVCGKNSGVLTIMALQDSLHGLHTGGRKSFAQRLLRFQPLTDKVFEEAKGPSTQRLGRLICDH